MVLPDYEALVDMTCWIRHLQGWEAGRQALRDCGIDPEKVICTYLGPGGSYASCDLLLPDGRFVSLDMDRDPATGHVYIPPEYVEAIPGETPLEQQAQQILTGGGMQEFDSLVCKRYDSEYRSREPVIRPLLGELPS